MATKMSRRYQTQWTSQFFAAGELTRRGYLVALTNGNANFADLLVQSPNELLFSVDVKGMSTKNWWLVKRPDSNEDRNDRYYILVYVPRDSTEAPHYFILSSNDMSEELKIAQETSKQLEIKRGIPFKIFAPGMGTMEWKQPFKYENQWDKLPE